MVKDTSIYVLKCPMDGKVKYIGLTQNMRSRYLSHINRPSTEMKDWMDMLKSKNLLPEMEEIMRLPRRCAHQEEKKLIEIYENRLGKLFNVKRTKRARRTLLIKLING